MGCNNRHGSIQKKKLSRKKSKKDDFPKVYVDQDLDYASIKLKKGIEAKSYLKDGFVFCEDKSGRVIEIQVLNLSDLKKIKAA